MSEQGSGFCGSTLMPVRAILFFAVTTLTIFVPFLSYGDSISYRADHELQLNGPYVVGWLNVEDGRKPLTPIRGHPKAVRVRLPEGEGVIVRLDGTSALACAASRFGSMEGARTILIYAKTSRESDGVFLDGATRKGSNSIHIRRDRWRFGILSEEGKRANYTPAVACANGWQVQAFVFEPRETGTVVTHRTRQDGRVVTQRSFLPGKAPLMGLVLGMNYRLQQPVHADVAEIGIFDRALTEREFEREAERMETYWGQPEDLAAQFAEVRVSEGDGVFRSVLRKQGDDGVHTYRIPGLATTSRGTLIAVFDVRHKSSKDLPADIDIGMMRSTDNGLTWSPMRMILDYDRDEPGSQGNGVGDPCIVVDRVRNRIFVFGVRIKGNSEDWRLVVTCSDDDGLTWKSKDITGVVRNPGWKMLFQGPGAGIQTRDGTLVVPAQYRKEDGRTHSCLLWSEDHGETWRISAPATGEKITTSECQVAELADGSLLLTMRGRKRTWARYTWKGSLENGQWSAPWFGPDDPICQASLLALSSGDLLFSNPSSKRYRMNLTIRYSNDEGRTWSNGRVLDPRPSSYSCMTMLKDGRIGILYEAGDSYAAEALHFAVFSPAWIRSAK